MPHGPSSVSAWFSRFAEWCSDQVGTPWFFIANVVLCGVGMAVPATYDFFIALISVLTWLVAILIQHSQNTQERALQLKLDELIRSHREARNEYIGIEKGKAR
jgi:low affinity Fe/Cu permease